MKATDKKPSPPEEEHKAIPLPERMDRPGDQGNRPQRTAGSRTPGKKGHKDMSEAAERKARREGAGPGGKEQ